jgi:DNA helicase IV
LQAERDHIGFLYRHLDAERAAAATQLEQALRDSGSRHQETRVLREVAVHTLSAQVKRFHVAEHGLCFGRVDHREGGRGYIGRIGLFDEEADWEPLLLDWRAPASRPFYAATGANPEGLSRRRHFRTNRRTIVDFHDDEFELNGAHDGDAALLAALDAPRAETMRDIVATIQAEQDEVIRLNHPGVVVIDGGPGTGKTAVALHRVAYLLYHQRERLSRAGVLIVGPSTGFLRYVGNVLPSLGENDVVFATPGELFPGLVTTREDPPDVKRLKGSAQMVDVIRAAIADRQELPLDPIEIELEDVTVSVDFNLAAAAREDARASGLRHNEARAVFVEAVIEALTKQATDLIDPDLHGMLGPDIRADLTEDPQLEAAIGQLWPALTPQRLLRDLYGSPSRCAVVHASRLYRAAAGAWTVSDVPLLDEAAELLGPLAGDQVADDEALEYAKGVLEILDTDENPYVEELVRASDLVTAEELAARHVELDNRSLAERAAADREWTYGHVVVDEAQELSEMDWRVIMRRCPTRSMTVVGDLAQRGSPAGAGSWEGAMAPFVADRWAYRRLSINYRTPAEVMDYAHRVLPEIKQPISVRHTGVLPAVRRVDDLSKAVRAELDAAVDGTVAVIAPAEVALDVPVPVLTPRAAKGLEFDVVIVVEPGLITHPNDLYVVLTRATQRLTVLHTAELPAGLRVE